MTLRMLVLLPGTLALLMSARPDHHGATPRPAAEEDSLDGYRWRVRDEDWRREHPGAARMLDQFEWEIKENRKGSRPEDCTADCE